MAKSFSAIEEIESQFAGNPVLCLRRLQELKTADFSSFAASSATFLSTRKDGQMTRMILHLIRENEADFDKLLFVEDTLAFELAAILANLAVRMDPKLLPHWIAELQNEIENGDLESKVGRIIRRLTIIAHCSDLIRHAFTFANLCAHDDARIRSKAVLLAAQIPNGKTTLKAIADLDNRVRANAIEAMWGRSDKQALELFQIGSSDSHHRSAANSLLGLHRAGQLSAIREMMKMAEDVKPLFSSAAIWAMGHSRDPKFLDFLQQRLRDTTTVRKRPLIKAARLIKQRKDQILALPRLSLELIRCECGDPGRMELAFLILNSSGQAISPAAIQPNHFLMHEGERRIEAFQVDIQGNTQPFHLLFLLPVAEFRITPFPEQLDQAMELAIHSKRDQDFWGMERYQTSTSTELRSAASMEFLRSGKSLIADLTGSKQRARNNFEASVEELIAGFPANAKLKHLVLVASPAWDACFEVPKHWEERCRRYGVIPHFLAATALDAIAVESWKSFCLRLGGSMIEFALESDLNATLRQFSLSLQSRFEIICHCVNHPPSQKTAEAVKVEIFCELGYGQLKIDPAARQLEEAV